MSSCLDGEAGPYPTPDGIGADASGGGLPCASGISLSLESLADSANSSSSLAGRTDQHTWVGEVGAFSCLVPTHLDQTNSLLGALVTRDFALYYREIYAWWSYDGDGFYTLRDAPGVAESGDGPALNNDANPSFSDAESAFQGHATLLISQEFSAPGASVVGSAETLNMTKDDPLFPTGLSDDPALAAGSNASLTNNACGSSPSNPPSGQPGPVIRAPNLDNNEPLETQACVATVYFLSAIQVADHEAGSDEYVLEPRAMTGGFVRILRSAPPIRLAEQACPSLFRCQARPFCCFQVRLRERQNPLPMYPYPSPFKQRKKAPYWRRHRRTLE